MGGYHPGGGEHRTDNLSVSNYLSIYLFIYLSIYLSIYLPIYLSIYLSILTWSFVNGPKRNCPYLYLQKTWRNLLSMVLIDSWLTSCRFTAMYACVVVHV